MKLKEFRRKRNAILAIAAAIATGLILLGRFGLKRGSAGQGQRGWAGSGLVAAGTELTAAEQFKAFEQRRALLDRTIWKAESEAEEYGGFFVELWDRLRATTNAVEVLERFRFGEMWLGTPGQAGEVGSEIQRRHFRGPARRVAWGEWIDLVRDWQAAGYVLEQSEWRQAAFEPAGSRAPRSIIEVVWHVSNLRRAERLIIRGRIGVEWSRGPRAEGGGVRAFPEKIEAADMELVVRVGEPPFEHVVAADLTPERPDEQLLEPSLHLYDLDGDGLSEIILMRRNRVFWNRGKGQFRPAEFCADLSSEVSAAVFGDFDGDAMVDFLGVDAGGLVLFKGEGAGRFAGKPMRVWTAAVRLGNPFVLTAGNADGDGDLDAWLGQYKVPYQGGQFPTPYYDANDGFPSFYLENDGAGRFNDQTAVAGLTAKRFRRTYSASLADLDQDGDRDLLVVSDFAGIDIYLNDGQGHFREATADLIDERHLFGMSHRLDDFNGDGHLDIFVVGMNSFAADRLERLGLGLPGRAAQSQMRKAMSYGNRLFFGNGMRFEQRETSLLVARSGWSWGATSGDFDNDGDSDIYVVNGHISGSTARDYDSQFWRHDIYLANSTEDRGLEFYFQHVQTRSRMRGESYGGFEKNRLYLNEAGASFVEAGYLWGAALEEDCRNVVSDDLDGDGKLDLLVMSLETWPRVRQVLHLFPNYGERKGHWVGVRLRECGRGYSPIGTRIVVNSGGRVWRRDLVAGESYRSQHAACAHFGLGTAAKVDWIDIIWPNGKRKRIENPAVDAYHRVAPDE